MASAQRLHRVRHQIDCPRRSISGAAARNRCSSSGVKSFDRALTSDAVRALSLSFSRSARLGDQQDRAAAVSGNVSSSSACAWRRPRRHSPMLICKVAAMSSTLERRTKHTKASLARLSLQAVPLHPAGCVVRLGSPGGLWRRGWVARVAPWVASMARVMDRPRPWPSLWSLHFPRLLVVETTCG